MKNVMGPEIVFATAVVVAFAQGGCGKDGLPLAPRPDASSPSLPDAAADDGSDAGTQDPGPDTKPPVSPPDVGPDTVWDLGRDGVATPDGPGDGARDGNDDVARDLGSPAPVLYAMTATLGARDGGYPGTPALPPTHAFSVLVDWAAGTATSGSNGTASQVALRQTGANEWEATQPLTFSLGWAAQPSLTYSDFKLTLGKDGCTAAASGTYLSVGGDVIYTTLITATMIGTLDRSGPQFSVVPTGAVHPLGFSGVLVNELLPAGTSATLDSLAASLALTSLPAAGSLGVSAFSLPAKALAFGATYDLHVKPAARDLGGNGTDALPSLATVADPGLFAQDGFEGPVSAYMVGFARVASSDGLPIPAGAGAVAAVPVGSAGGVCPARLTARLAVPSGATSVKVAFMTYRPRSGWGQSSYAYTFTVAVPNGAAVSTYDFNLATTPLPKPWADNPPGGDTNTYGDLLEAQLPLPAGVGKEVLFDVARICAQPAPPAPGIIIDNLRVE